jgi:hypothetical protein
MTSRRVPGSALLVSECFHVYSHAQPFAADRAPVQMGRAGSAGHGCGRRRRIGWGPVLGAAPAAHSRFILLLFSFCAVAAHALSRVRVGAAFIHSGAYSSPTSNGAVTGPFGPVPWGASQNWSEEFSGHASVSEARGACFSSAESPGFSTSTPLLHVVSYELSTLRSRASITRDPRRHLPRGGTPPLNHIPNALREHTPPAAAVDIGDSGAGGEAAGAAVATGATPGLRPARARRRGVWGHGLRMRPRGRPPPSIPSPQDPAFNSLTATPIPPPPPVTPP